MVYVPLPLSAMPLPTDSEATLAPLTVAVTTSVPVVRLLPLASLAWTAIVVAVPAVPAGTVAVEAVADVPAADTVMPADVAVTRLPLENWMVIALARFVERSVNVTTPATAVLLTVPPSVPAPPKRTAVTIVELSDATRLPEA